MIAAVKSGAFTTPVYAYLDPGTGSMILQGVLAAVGAIAVTSRFWWNRLLVLLRIRKPSSPPRNTASADRSREVGDS